MNIKRWLLASLAVLVVVAIAGFVIHHLLLADLYKQTASVWRPEAEFARLMWLFWVGNVLYSLMFALIYTRGYETGKPGLGQGLRYGIYMGLLICVALGFSWYVVLPIPAVLSVYWAVGGLIESAIAGIAVGLIYKP